MQIQFNSDESLALNQQLSDELGGAVNHTLERFDDRLTRVEIHLSDLNGPKSGPPDKRCLMEARPAGQEPVAVTNEAPTVELAVHGAASKMSRLLSSRFGRLEDRA